MNEKRRHGDRPFDLRPATGALLGDLDRRRFEDEYLPAAFAADVLAGNDRSYEQRLAATKMVVGADEPTPTVLGVLVLRSRPHDFVPGAYLQFLRIDGRELADPVSDELVMDGPVAEVLRRIDEKLASHHRIAVDLGIATARRELAANGNPPLEFDANPTHVGVTLRAAL